MRIKQEVEVDVGEDAIRDYAKNVLHMTSVADRVPDEEIKRIAIEDLGLVDPEDEDALQDIKEDNDWMSSDDFASEWREYVDENEIEDYARDNLEMMTLDDLLDDLENYAGWDALKDWAMNNFTDLWDEQDDDNKNEYTKDWLGGEWSDIIDESEIIEYATEYLDMISVDDVYDYVRDNPDGEGPGLLTDRNAYIRVCPYRKQV